MPLTAYSISSEKEEDVEQVLKRLSTLFGECVSAAEAIPETWRAFIRQDLQCPCCFVTGAELVKAAYSTASKNPLRQPCFRFNNPKHRDHCDFGSTEKANTVPENLVAFSDSNSPITKAVRELVGTGIELALFSHKSIRDMREWFFNKKVQSMFLVTLDPRFPKWMHSLYREKFYSKPGKEVELTLGIVASPKFSWRAAVAREQLLRHPEYRAFSEAFHKKPNPFFLEYSRMGTLARRFQGRSAFDPSMLEEEYEKTCELARFIAINYKPLKLTTSNKVINVSSVLALAALLMYVRDWNQDFARADFMKIVGAAGSSNQELGNVMGLNPFHDFRTWQALKAIQEFGVQVAEYVDLKAERVAIEQQLRAKLGAPPMPVE
ncbi:UNVERIFIED_ORG: hypothetical protein JN05_03509 [Zoogloea ramigera]|uniref:Uncharacterized protein n=1 Tax=Duganella zoogloeoides TaxID=75659 RepID=A0ABZ0Y065_9BURK|nr:hypothetical protein [Duganella zoogloeoides]WQH05429.1 hypothetical protein SR858_03565 [Duganella zoogloeoides]